MNILDKIVEKTKIRIEKFKSQNDFERIKEAAFNSDKEDFLFEKSLKKDDISFICEIKKASPSKGVIANDFPYLDIAREYENIGADAISVLTEPDFFLGSTHYLKEIASTVKTPILRKDFIIDEIMIYQAKIIGADAVLLITSILDDDKLKKYIKLADELGMSSLVETHNEDEIKRAVCAGSRIIGVNNRDLKTFNVDIKNSIKLRSLVPENILFVSESGIKTNEQIKELKMHDINAVLIGETFMKSKNKKREFEKLKGIIQ